MCVLSISASAFGPRIRLKAQHRRPSSSTLKRTMEASGSTGQAGGAPQPTEQRIAENGHAYTLQQFFAFYQEDVSEKWKNAARVQASECVDNGDATQLAAEPAVAQVLALPCICTLEAIENLEPVKDMGGKQAAAKQKELRAKCLAEKLWEIDVTHYWAEWRAVLRALSQDKRANIIGDGIACIKVRLLENVVDTNYVRVAGDSGERHVFEIVRVDTSTVHLHFHKKGGLDDPPHFPPLQGPPDATSGASQPTAAGYPPSASAPKIGRRESIRAWTVLLDHCWPGANGAVDITDGKGFDWKRYTDNIKSKNAVAAMNIDKVFVMRTGGDHASPMLAFAETDGTWWQLDPKAANEKTALASMNEDWRQIKFFDKAKKVDHSWMRLQ